MARKKISIPNQVQLEVEDISTVVTQEEDVSTDEVETLPETIQIVKEIKTNDPCMGCKFKQNSISCQSCVENKRK